LINFSVNKVVGEGREENRGELLASRVEHAQVSEMPESDSRIVLDEAVSGFQITSHDL
jgi:hypothetical protein